MAIQLSTTVRNARLDAIETAIGACRNYADTIGELFAAIDGFATWVAREADGQALDKQACYDSWPH